MSHPSEKTIYRNYFIIWSVALIFTLIWALSGANDMKMLFVFVSFIFFLHSGIKYEEASSHNSH